MGNTCCHPKDIIETVYNTPEGEVIHRQYVDRTL